jgi:hypothetical protein
LDDKPAYFSFEIHFPVTSGLSGRNPKPFQGRLTFLFLSCINYFVAILHPHFLLLRYVAGAGIPMVLLGIEI